MGLLTIKVAGVEQQGCTATVVIPDVYSTVG
jgi:hypothetical protein